MRYLKRFVVITSLISMLGACYVERREPRYARYTRRDCAYGWHWDGYRCHRYRRW